MRIVDVGVASPGPLVPQLNLDKTPALRDDERFLGHLTGEGVCQYRPWPAAPAEDVSPMWGHTTFYFTPDRLIYVCPNFVAAEQARDYVSNRESFGGLAVGLAASYLSQSKNNARAQRAVTGKALAGQLPWEYLSEIQVIPGPAEHGGAFFSFYVLAGDACYCLTLYMPRADLSWARQQAEWCLKVALHQRLLLLGDGVLPTERAVIQSMLENPRPDFGTDGSLSYLAPVALDGGHALTLL